MPASPECSVPSRNMLRNRKAVSKAAPCSSVGRPWLARGTAWAARRALTKTPEPRRECTKPWAASRS